MIRKPSNQTDRDGLGAQSPFALMHGGVKLEEPCLRVLVMAIERLDPQSLTAEVAAKDIGLAGTPTLFEQVLEKLSGRSVFGRDADGRRWVAPLCWGSCVETGFRIHFPQLLAPQLKFLRDAAPSAPDLCHLLRAPRLYVIALYRLLRALAPADAPWGLDRPLELSMAELRRGLGQAVMLPPLTNYAQPSDFFQYAIDESLPLINRVTNLRVRAERIQEGPRAAIIGIRIHLDAIIQAPSSFEPIDLAEDFSSFRSSLKPRRQPGLKGRPPKRDLALAR